MLVKNKNIKFNMDMLILMKDETNSMTNHVAQLSFAMDVETGSIHSFVNVINKELYNENIKEINETIAEMKEEFTQKVSLFGFEAETLML